jgi:hypothetical protein
MGCCGEVGCRCESAFVRIVCPHAPPLHTHTHRALTDLLDEAKGMGRPRPRQRRSVRCSLRSVQRRTVHCIPAFCCVCARGSLVFAIDGMGLCGLRLWCGRDALLACWCSNAFKRALDRYCGLCITALYFLYISVVKGALSVFDCSKNEDGVRILDADPSIVCDQVCVCRMG